jgi:iron complex outermembrane recepter protein
MNRLWAVAMCMFACTLVASAASAAMISGRVIDKTGAVVAGAEVTVTNATLSRKTTTGADGTFTVADLPAGTYAVTVEKSGFAPYTDQTLSLRTGQTVSISPTMTVGSLEQSIEVRGRALPEPSAQPTQDQVFKSDQTLRVLDRTQIDALGPLAGSGQVISLTPGANVTGYGQTGATKTTIAVNGIHQGWGGYGGLTDSGSLGVTFDGIPIADPATNLWQSPTLPQTFLIQNANVTYGPGDPATRVFNSIGGGVEFTPLQPAMKPAADFNVTYGRFSQKNVDLALNTGLHDGWSAMLAGGGGSGESFRRGVGDNFANPSHDYALYGKVDKSVMQNTGSFSGGGYYAHSQGYRPQVIPVTNQGISINAQPGAPLYSQDTSGFYSSLPYGNYNKLDTNVMGLAYGRERFVLNGVTTLENTTWLMHISRLHNRLDDVFSPGPQVNEYNDPHTNSEGDRVTLTETLPANTIMEGAYFIHTLYNTKNNFYNPADGGGTNTVNIGGKIRSGDFDMGDVAAYLQDEIQLGSRLSITPGLRYVRFSTSYTNVAAGGFSFAPGVVLISHCPITLAATPGNTKDQGASCPDTETRNGVEPSLNVTAEAASWLTLYGGYMGAYKTPQVGGGGGPFQNVDPTTYHLARQHFYQAGFKVHPAVQGPLSSLLVGAAYFHENYDDQEIDVDLANGDTIQANGSSTYDGMNMFVDASPTSAVHLYANGNVEKARYGNYVTGGVTYNGLPVAYVPSAMLDAGVYFNLRMTDTVALEPTVSFQYTGPQHLFDNTVGAPSSQTLAAFGTLNLGVKVPLKQVDFSVTMLNVTNNRYNQYEYISSGGYFGTPNGGYSMAYPGAPFTIAMSLGLHL